MSLDNELVRDAIARVVPDVVAVDSLDFPACCQKAATGLGANQVVVIGPDPDPAYRHMALDQGASAWVSQDRIADDVTYAVWTTLGCDHRSCPLQPFVARADPSAR